MCGELVAAVYRQAGGKTCVYLCDLFVYVGEGVRYGNICLPNYTPQRHAPSLNVNGENQASSFVARIPPSPTTDQNKFVVGV